MRIYQYKNYQDYVDNQTRCNIVKETWKCVREGTIERILKICPTAKNILCHGTRNGAEQKYFAKHFPDAYIIGTEISHTASKYEMTIQHDFSKEKPEWIGKFDVIYTNAFDHSICPEETLEVWKNQLDDEGKLFLEYSQRQSICDRNDPLDATEKEVESMLRGVDLNILNKHRGGFKNQAVMYECVKEDKK